MRSAAIRSNRSDGEIYIQAASSSDFVSIGTEDRNNLLKVNGNGNVNINYGNLDVTDGSVSATDGIFSGDIIANGQVEVESLSVSSLNTAPASATATGTTGQIKYSEDYIYVCTATNTWKRTAITTW